MFEAIVKTKLYLPPARPNRVPRPRLIQRLNNLGPLALIAAPAGFGKTTLLSEWIPQNQYCVTWVSLDDGDNDFPRFWVYAIRALQMLRAGLGQSALALVQSTQPPPATTMLNTLINEITDFEEDFSLVLDDYHTITKPDIHQALAYLLEHIPPQMHLVLASRSDPPLPLARFRARDQLTEIRADDLRFTADEAATFLNQAMGLRLPAEDITALEARNEGWIAGLQLAALSMQGRDDPHEFIQAFSGSHRHVLSYLVEEVLNRRPKGTLDFLLRTSILDRMTGPLCDALTGQSDGQAVLEKLEQANLFMVPLDDEGKWYRYHHMFADVLRIRLMRASPLDPSPLLAEVPELHRRASLWYEQAGLLEESMRHALAAPDHHLAASLVERHAMQMLLRSEVILLRNWLEQLPGEIIETRPRLALAKAWVLLFGNRLESTEQMLSTTVLCAPGLPVELTGELALLRAIMARFKREPEVAFKKAQEALNDLPEDYKSLRASALLEIGLAYKWLGDSAAAMRILNEVVALGESQDNWTAPLIALEAMRILHARKGRLSRVAKTCETAIRMAAGWGSPLPPLAGMAYVGLGEVQCERNDLERAEHTLQQGLRLLLGTIEDEPIIHGYFALARIAQARGDPDKAHASVQRAEDWFQQIQFARPWTIAHLEALHARLWIWQGNLAPAQQWAEAGGLDIQDPPDELTEVQEHEYLTWARLRIAQGRSDPTGSPLTEALHMLDHLLRSAEAAGRLGSMIEIHSLRALALYAQGRFDAALDSLAHALNLAEPEGYTRTFLDEGRPMHALLLKAGRLRGNSLQKSVQRLLLEFEKYAPTHPVSGHETFQLTTLIEPLTARELDILRSVAEGASNQVIAEKLYLSTGTVKVHLKHIFGKLGVANRTQAVGRARELNLL